VLQLFNISFVIKQSTLKKTIISMNIRLVILFVLVAIGFRLQHVHTYFYERSHGQV
jgi:hypothetical protein